MSSSAETKEDKENTQNISSSQDTTYWKPGQKFPTPSPGNGGK